MRCLCLSSSKYASLIPGFSMLWAKYVNLPVTIVCHSLERPWCESAAETVSGIKDKQILLVLEDYWVREPVNNEQLNLLLDGVKHGAAKADLQAQVAYFAHTSKNGVLIADQDACYRASTQAAIWDRDYLLNALACGGDAWTFELQASLNNDGRMIIGLNNNTITYSNIMLRGQAMDYEAKRISETDWNEMRTAGVLPAHLLAVR